MRKREDIEQNKFGDKYIFKDLNYIIIELLLDIRDLLIPKK